MNKKFILNKRNKFQYHSWIFNIVNEAVMQSQNSPNILKKGGFLDK